MHLYFQPIAAAVAVSSAALAASSTAQSRAGEGNWAVCSFEVSEGTHVAQLLFEPFRIAGDSDSFPSIRERFEDEVGVASVLPGYEPFTDTTIGYSNVDGCAVFPSEDEARARFDERRNARGYRFTQTVEWKPADNVTGLARRPSEKTEPAEQQDGDAAENAASAVDAARRAAQEAE